MGIAEARREALLKLAAIQSGGDPVEERRQVRAARKAERAESTVEQRAAEWQEARRRDWSDRHANEIARVINRDVLPKLGSRRLRETVRAD